MQKKTGTLGMTENFETFRGRVFQASALHHDYPNRSGCGFAVALVSGARHPTLKWTKGEISRKEPRTFRRPVVTCAVSVAIIAALQKTAKYGDYICK